MTNEAEAEAEAETRIELIFSRTVAARGSILVERENKSRRVSGIPDPP
jgi:hypothetical protein